MLDFVTSPIRSVLGVAEHDLVSPLQGTREIETHILEAVNAIHHAAASIEQHVAVIETLATSVAPLGASVNRLTDTMHDLVELMAPMGAAEHEVKHVEHFFGWHRHKKPEEHAAEQPDPGSEP
jgi:uncharacterized protein YoxC